MRPFSRRHFASNFSSREKTLCVRRIFRQNTYFKFNREINFKRQIVEEYRVNQVDSGITPPKETNLLNVSGT
jgi:hypothetical protein